MDIGELIEIDVESLGYSACAVGRSSGMVVFVHGGVPGDKLRARITRIRKNYAVAEMVDVLFPSPHRRQPPCVHFIEGCGGCQWQHIAYAQQIQWKQEVIRQSLKRIGKLEGMPEIFDFRSGILDFEDQKLYYRNRLRLFPLADGRTLGMRRTGSHQVVPIRGCLISSRKINSLGGMFRGEIFSAEGKLDEVDIRSSDEHQQVMVSCTYHKDGPGITGDIDRISNMPGVSSVFYRVASRSGGHGKLKLGYGEPVIKEEIRGIEYKIGPECFFQINAAGLKELVGLVREFAGKDNRLILDAHCGVGTFALQMADISDTVWGTDISSSSISLARTNATDNGITSVRFRKGTAADVLQDELRGAKIDMAILDPPRKGCEKPDLQALIRSLPAKMIYISCNPTTLARDLRDLVDSGYKLLRLAMIDMFPMTYHLEVVAFCIRQG